MRIEEPARQVTGAADRPIATESRPSGHRLLVFDTAYTFKIMQEREVEILATCRDLDGYFDHVWTVHPVASLFAMPGDADRLGHPTEILLAPRHTMIEGKVGRYGWLRWFPALNLLFSQVGLLRKLRALAREQRIDVIRAEDAQFSGLMALILARSLRLPLMIGVWGSPKSIRAQKGAAIMPRVFRWIWLEERVERFVLRRADRVVVHAEEDRAFAVESGTPVRKTALFMLGNALHRCHFVEPQSRPSGRDDLDALGVGAGDTLMCVSRLEKLKLVADAIHVVRNLRDAGRRVTLLMVGGGGYQGELERLAEELGVSDQIIFCGNRTQKWLARVIPEVSVVISPYTGRALGEAALGGAPIVAYAVDWHEVFVRDGDTGLLAPLSDHQAMAAAVERLLTDRSAASRMGNAVRARAMEVFDLAKINGEQVSVYEAMIAEVGRPKTGGPADPA